MRNILWVAILGVCGAAFAADSPMSRAGTAFPVVPVGSYRFSSSGRNIVDGPGTVVVNLSLSEQIRIAS